MKIYLIAGHQINKRGANGIFKEEIETIKLRDSIAEYLKQHNLEAITDNDTQNLSEVISMINKTCLEDDLIIDIHFNAYNGKSRGTEAFTYSQQLIAQRIVNITSDSLKIPNRGVKNIKYSQHNRLAILQDTKCKAILWEVCFCDNKEDVNNYKNNKTILINNIAELLLNIQNQ